VKLSAAARVALTVNNSSCPLSPTSLRHLPDLALSSPVDAALQLEDVVKPLLTQEGARALAPDTGRAEGHDLARALEFGEVGGDPARELGGATHAWVKQLGAAVWGAEGADGRLVGVAAARRA